MNPHSVWTISEIAEAVKGRIIHWGPPAPITTDTRTLTPPGQWFLPLIGQNHDAHKFITPHLSTTNGGGCTGVIANHVCPNWDMGFVQVDGNTMDALHNLAVYSRNNITGCFVAVTGSVGKTTTKNMIGLALESIGSVYQSPGNYNNHVGVALSLVGLHGAQPGSGNLVDFGVLELGMSERSEILELSRMCRPNVRVVLNVGASHLENFASLKEIALAKGEILREAKPGDVCVLNADDPLVVSLPVPPGVNKVLFGRRKGCDVRLVLAEMIDQGHGVNVVLERNREMIKFVIPSPGLHLALNACAAAAVTSCLGVPLSLVGKSLSKFSSVNGRLQLEVTINGLKIINDTYNSSPSRTMAAIDLLRRIGCKGKRVAILGDMLELGPSEVKLHGVVLRYCCDSHFDIVGLVGKRFLTAAENLNVGGKIKLLCASNAEILALQIEKNLNCCDVVLVKGSCGMQMEKIVDVIKSFDSQFA